MSELVAALNGANFFGKPTVIIANTVKAKGAFMENVANGTTRSLCRTCAQALTPCGKKLEEVRTKGSILPAACICLCIKRTCHRLH